MQESMALVGLKVVPEEVGRIDGRRGIISKEARGIRMVQAEFKKAKRLR